MEEGEKYLNVSIWGGKSFSVFPVKKKNPDEPDFRGNGVSIWVNTKKPKVEAVNNPL